MLSNDQVQKFKELYKKYYGIELDQNQAFEQALKLIQLIEVVYRQDKANGKEILKNK